MDLSRICRMVKVENLKNWWFCKYDQNMLLLRGRKEGDLFRFHKMKLFVIYHFDYGRFCGVYALPKTNFKNLDACLKTNWSEYEFYDDCNLISDSLCDDCTKFAFEKTKGKRSKKRTKKHG